MRKKFLFFSIGLILLVLFVSGCKQELDQETIQDIIAKEKIENPEVELLTNKDIYYKETIEEDFELTVKNNGKEDVNYNKINDKFYFELYYYSRKEWRPINYHLLYPINKIALHITSFILKSGESVNYGFDAFIYDSEIKRGFYKIQLNYFKETNEGRGYDDTITFFQVI